jgi:hypothetical protein
MNTPSICRPSVLWLAAISLVGGCGSSPVRPPPDAGDDGGDAGPACDGPAASNLAGVSLSFPDDRCRFTLAEVAAGIQIDYAVVVAQSLSGVHPQQTDGSRCGQPGSSGLIVDYTIGGNGQSYCLCDRGLCAPNATFTTSLSAGSTPVSIAWDGKNWNGPSDTQNPEGAPFPPGTYLLSLAAAGAVDSGGDASTNLYSITASRYITITP